MSHRWPGSIPVSYTHLGTQVLVIRHPFGFHILDPVTVRKDNLIELCRVQNGEVTVSYTHLDVYKRQAHIFVHVIVQLVLVLYFAHVAVAKYRVEWITIHAVSYTHLDVYKRQVTCWALCERK